MTKKLNKLAIIVIVQLILSILEALLQWRAFVILLVLFALVVAWYYIVPFVLGQAIQARIWAWWKSFARSMATRTAARYTIGAVWILVFCSLLMFGLRQPELGEFIRAAVDGTPTHTPAPTPTATPPPATPGPTALPTWTPYPTATPSPMPTPTPIFHVIREGENPWCISMAHYHTGALWGLICKANVQFSSLEECAENLRVGDELWIPAKPDFPQSPIPDPLPVPWVRGKDYICEPEEGKELQAPLTSQH